MKKSKSNYSNMTNTVYLGIDPGQSGGLAALYYGSVTVSVKMPETERDIWDWFSPQSECLFFAVIEKVGAMPGNGVASMFKFGKGYGGLRMALVAAGIPFEEVPPRKWQKGLGIVPRHADESKTEFKNRLKAVAQQLFPKEKITLATADALLIAEYCRRKRQGTL